MIDKTNYSNIGFIVVGNDGYRQPSRCADKHEYEKLLNYAISKKYFIYYGEVKDDTILLPYYLDENCLKEVKVVEHKVSEKVVKQIDDEMKAESLICPKCEKICNSKSGYTLHIKSCDK